MEAESINNTIILNYFIWGLVSYLIGTFPSALFIIRMVKGADIRKEGTGNIGAMNSYDITGKKWVGFSVFFLDALKGLFAVFLVKIFFSNLLIPLTVTAFCVVLGHNFNIFLKFKGGRGLATSVGAYSLINPLMIVFWAIMWLVGYYIIKRNVHVANVFATIFMPLMFYYTPEQITILLNFTDDGNKINTALSMIPLVILILIRHFSPLSELLKARMDQINKNE